jgi:hypothetical protein
LSGTTFSILVISAATAFLKSFCVIIFILAPPAGAAAPAPPAPPAATVLEGAGADELENILDILYHGAIFLCFAQKYWLSNLIGIC